MMCKNGCGELCLDLRFDFCSDECAIEYEETHPVDAESDYINEEVAGLRHELGEKKELIRG